MRKIFFFDLDGSMLDTAKGEYALPPKIMYSVHFKKDLKMCLVNVKKRFFQKRT